MINQQVKVGVANNDKRAKCWCGTGKVGVATATPAIRHSPPMGEVHPGAIPALHQAETYRAMSAVQRHRLPCGPVSMVCGEAAETPAHVLLECPCLYGPRLRMLGNIVATERGLSNDDVVAAFAAGYTAYKSRSSAATSPPRGDDGGEQQQQQPARDRVTVAGQQRGGRRLAGPAGVTCDGVGRGRLYKGQQIFATYS